MNNYDLIILGGGPAGYNAAEKAALRGLKVLLAEKESLGGTCLNSGCIPSKVLIKSAKTFEDASKAANYGIELSVGRLNHKTVVDRKKRVVSTLVSGVGAKLKKAGVETINAEGRIVKRSSGGFTVSIGEQLFEGKNLLICTGAEALLPGIPGLRKAYDEGFVLTNREIFDLAEPPKELAVIGGGVIGIEMAVYFNYAGSHVTILEALDRIATDNDPEISIILRAELKKKGIDVKTLCRVTELADNSLSYTDEKDSQSTLSCDAVICAIGRKPRIENLGLENVGVYIENGAIVTDDMLRTNVPGIYAAGDVNGKVMLASTAYREGEVAVNNICGVKDRMDYTCIPKLIYSLPEISSVGLTAQQARERGLKVREIKTSMLMSGRYLAENDGGCGICKIVADEDKNTVAGVHMIGGCAAENIYTASLLVGTELNIEKIKKTVFPHPTEVEVLREAIFEV